MENGFIIVNKLSDPDKLDSMGLPVYEEFCIPTGGLVLSKQYVEFWQLNGERYDNDPNSSRQRAYEQAYFKIHGHNHPSMSDIATRGGEYRYFVRSPLLTNLIEVSVNEYKRLRELLIKNQTGEENE